MLNQACAGNVDCPDRSELNFLETVSQLPRARSQPGRQIVGPDLSRGVDRSRNITPKVLCIVLERSSTTATMASALLISSVYDHCESSPTGNVTERGPRALTVVGWCWLGQCARYFCRFLQREKTFVPATIFLDTSLRVHTSADTSMIALSEGDQWHVHCNSCKLLTTVDTWHDKY